MAIYTVFSIRCIWIFLFNFVLYLCINKKSDTSSNDISDFVLFHSIIFYLIYLTYYLAVRFISIPPYCINIGANTKDTIVISLIRMLIDGPDVPLKGSPTVSPTTAAL